MSLLKKQTNVNTIVLVGQSKIYLKLSNKNLTSKQNTIKLNMPMKETQTIAAHLSPGFGGPSSSINLMKNAMPHKKK